LVDSAQDRDYWRDLVNSALNLRVPLAMELVMKMKYLSYGNLSDENVFAVV